MPSSILSVIEMTRVNSAHRVPWIAVCVESKIPQLPSGRILAVFLRNWLFCANFDSNFPVHLFISKLNTINNMDTVLRIKKKT